MSEETVELKTGWYLSKAPQSEKFLMFEDFEKNIYYGINAHGDWLLGKGARKSHSMHSTTREIALHRLALFAIEKGYKEEQSKCLFDLENTHTINLLEASYFSIDSKGSLWITNNNMSAQKCIMKDGIWADFFEEKKPTQTELSADAIKILKSTYERPNKTVDTREELKIHLDFEKEMNCSRSITEIYNECLEELKEKLIERDVIEIGIFERKVRHIVEENNRLLSLTAKQQLEIEGQNEMLEENSQVKKDLTGMFYNIGAPLNDNVLRFNKDQLKWCFKVVERIEEITTKK